MAGDYTTSVHSRIEKYAREATINPRASVQANANSDPSAYLRRIQNLREETSRWDANRLRSGARRITRVTYQDTIPIPETMADGNALHSSRETPHLQMRRYRDAELARRRQPPPQPRIGSIRGHRISDQPPYTLDLTASAPAMTVHSSEEPMVDPPDLDILRRLLRTPSRVLAKSSNPWARLGSPHGMIDSKSPANVPSPQSTSSTAGARLPPVRGRLLPISMARTLRSGRQRLEDSLKATRLPYVDSSPQWHRMTSNNDSVLHSAAQPENSCGAAMVPDLHGFRIYQHLMGAETHRVIAQRHASSTVHRGAPAVSGEEQNTAPHNSERHPLLPMPSFPITQLLTKNPDSSKSRVDYISINIAIPRAETCSVSQTPPPPPVRPPSRVNSEGTFVPPPSPAYQMNSGLESRQEVTWADQQEQQTIIDCYDSLE